MSEKATNASQKSSNLTNFTNKFKGMLTIISFQSLVCLKNVEKLSKY